MKKLPIGVRLTVWYLVIFALGEFVFGAGMWTILHQSLYDIVDDSLENQRDDIKALLLNQKPDATAERLRDEIKETYSRAHSGDYLAIYQPDGTLLYCSPLLESHTFALLPPSRFKRPLSRSRRIENQPIRFLYQKIDVNGREYTVEIGTPADDAVGTLTLFRSYLLVFAPFLVIAAAVLGHWMSRKALAPVDELVRTARDVSGASLGKRLPKLETGDELQRLSDTLNEMLDRIEAAFLRISQFTADASHELRTPVSLIRTESELALRRARGEEEYRESLRHILAEAERTTGLIEQLLALARADSGREALQISEIDLRPMLQSAVDGWQSVAASRGLQFSADMKGEDVAVRGDASLLRRVIDILLDNAFKYTPAPGSVRLALAEKADEVEIAVQDSGIGIDPQEQSKIFERFYRVDKARSRDQGGAGLGLAIAQWVVTQHRGTITVQSAQGQGTTFRILLPKIAASVRADPQPV